MNSSVQLEVPKCLLSWEITIQFISFTFDHPVVHPYSSTNIHRSKGKYCWIRCKVWKHNELYNKQHRYLLDCFCQLKLLAALAWNFISNLEKTFYLPYYIAYLMMVSSNSIIYLFWRWETDYLEFKKNHSKERRMLWLASEKIVIYRLYWKFC